MTDLHCHILPGLDDGSDSFDTSCRMAAMAARGGVRRIVATPHCNTPGARKNFRSRELTGALTQLQAELDRWQIPVRLLPGCELLVRENLEELLDREQVLTLNGSRYLLVEFYFNERPEVLERSLAAVERRGLVPVIAHPERYDCVQDNLSLAQRWAERGRPLQLNKGSLLGDLGEGAYDAAARLLRSGLVSVIASDAHHYRYRSPDPERLLRALERRFPAVDPDELLRRNPRRIVDDLPL